MDYNLNMYELRRYNDLKDIIFSYDFDKIGGYFDYDIIRKTDLKEIIRNTFLNFEYDPSIDYFTILMKLQEIFSDDIYDDEELIKKGLMIEIDYGIYPEADLEYVENVQIYDDYFLEKIKDSNYRIGYAPSKFINDDNFIRYCISNKNLSIFSCIGKVEDKYFDSVNQLIGEGYGFDRLNIDNNSLKIIDSLVNNGYIVNGLDFIIERYDLDVLLLIFKRIIDNDIDIHICNTSNYVSLNSLRIDSFTNELFKYIVMNKKYKYLELIKDKIRYTDDNVKLLISELKNEASIVKYIDLTDKRFYTDEVVLLLLDNDMDIALKLIMNLQIDNDKFLEFLKIKLREKRIIKLNTSCINYLVNKKDYELIDLFIDNDINNLYLIFNYVNQMNIEFYNKDVYDVVKKYIVDIYNFNSEHLDIFVEKFGYMYLCYLENINIRNAINLDDVSFRKYLELFNIDMLNLNDVQNIYDSILQYRFKSEHNYDREMFKRIKLSITNQNADVPRFDISILARNINIDKIRKLGVLTDEQIKMLEYDSFLFLMSIYDSIKHNINVDNNLKILHKIFCIYLEDKREKYREKHNYLDEVSLDYKYDEKELRDSFILFTYKDYDLGKISTSIKLDYQLIEGIDNSVVIFSVIKYLLKDYDSLIKIYKRFPLTEEMIKKSIKDVKKILSESDAVNRNMENQYFEISVGQYYKVKKHYYPKFDEKRLFKLLSEINPYEMRDTVFNNDDKYNSLIDLLNKYKFIYWQDVFGEALKKSKIECSDSSLATFISKFSEIYEYVEMRKKKKMNTNLTDMLKYADILSSSSSRYSILFGKEDCEFLLLNPSPFDAPIEKNSNERLEIAVTDLCRLYNRRFISVPPIDMDVDVNGKLINVNLGNFTNPINLTYGERTHSCMRINGSGKTLYNFCQNNVNGFHLRLSNPSNGNLISRVSGYRNGNSIFLNQLRDSLDFIYSNDDLFNALKIVANYLIEITKDSNCPIENIFISNGYALVDNNNLVSINENIRAGLPNFYFDLCDAGIVLKTTAVDRSYSKINTDKSNVEVYQVLRDKVREFGDKKEIYDNINKFVLLKNMLLSNNVNSYMNTSLISLEIVNDIKYLIAGEDFIAYLDKDLNIVTDYIERKDNRVFGEIKRAVDILNKKKEDIESEGRNRHSK